MIDAHLHLQDPRLDRVRDSYLADLPALGILKSVVNGTCEKDWDAVESLARHHPRVIPFFGLHPWKAGSETVRWAEDLKARLDRRPDAGVGEIGLDRWIRGGDFERQKEVFAIQLGIAGRLRRPVALHCLQAWGTMLQMCRDASLSGGLLLHSYGGPAELVPDFVELGAYFSISGYFFRPGKESKRDVFKEIPLDRLLIETDAPDMAPPLENQINQLPDDSGGGWNHPGNLGSVYESTASLRGLPVGELALRVRRNFEAWIHVPAS